ncbi:hypothetical protein V2J09_006794 [Rumex salicifolius]
MPSLSSVLLLDMASMILDIDSRIVRIRRAHQYLTFTRPDILYVVQQVCLHIHDPRERHLLALKKILRHCCTQFKNQLWRHYTIDCFADIMTKGLPRALFVDFISSLCIRSTPDSTTGLLE